MAFVGFLVTSRIPSRLVLAGMIRQGLVMPSLADHWVFTEYTCVLGSVLSTAMELKDKQALVPAELSLHCSATVPVLPGHLVTSYQHLQGLCSRAYPTLLILINQWKQGLLEGRRG